MTDHTGHNPSRRGNPNGRRRPSGTFGSPSGGWSPARPLPTHPHFAGAVAPGPTGFPSPFPGRPNPYFMSPNAGMMSTGNGFFQPTNPMMPGQGYYPGMQPNPMHPMLPANPYMGMYQRPGFAMPMNVPMSSPRAGYAPHMDNRHDRPPRDDHTLSHTADQPAPPDSTPAARGSGESSVRAPLRQIPVQVIRSEPLDPRRAPSDWRVMYDGHLDPAHRGKHKDIAKRHNGQPEGKIPAAVLTDPRLGREPVLPKRKVPQLPPGWLQAPDFQFDESQPGRNIKCSLMGASRSPGALVGAIFPTGLEPTTG
ncbi:hypothetical protein BJ085DRAFT_28864 [Dimargaris cristalligena]|uniref:Uncharacterized protein n=1 Tax=Dimargaris cristalligena TaxID=215637 RepID=A0A4P9ZZX5_9FUNG|nr:hypothetical protein BJ085DRAFT_28864 [Dimargaris cristalligena]|eukprot:RKP38701.1 hypothetical protein BJ085DRAFT_28864 [Dimargaris cristalligena]